MSGKAPANFIVAARAKENHLRGGASTEAGTADWLGHERMVDSESRLTEHPATRLLIHLFRDLEGWMGFLSGRRQHGKLVDVRQHYLRYPEEVGSVAAWAEGESGVGRETFFCVHLLTRPERRKDAASDVLALWVDADGVEVPDELPPPTAVVETSPGRHHDYWGLSSSVPPEEGAVMSRSLARILGADPSGWDLSQLLRLPGTRNYKYPEAPPVRLTMLRANSRRDTEKARQRLLPALSSDRDGQAIVLAVPVATEPPVALDRESRRAWDGVEFVRKDHGEVDRSESLYRLAAILKAAEASRAVVLAALAERDAALGWHKYTDRPEEYERICEKLFTEPDAKAQPAAKDDLYRFVLNLDEVAELEWLVEGVLPAGGVAVLAGKENTFKSFLALDLLNHVTAGRDWHGRRIKAGPGVFIAGEGLRGLKRRQRAWTSKNGLLRWQMAYLTHAVPLTDMKAVDRLARSIGSAMPELPVLIVVDTLSRALTGIDENSQKEMSRLVANAEWLAREFSATVLLVHHTDKGQSGLRGSSVLAGGVDTILTVDGRNSLSVRLKCNKQKDAAEFAPLLVELQEHEDSLCVANVRPADPPGRNLRSVAGFEAKVLAVLTKADAPMRHGEWKAAAKASHGLNDGQFDRARKSLFARDLVARTENGCWRVVEREPSSDDDNDEP